MPLFLGIYIHLERNVQGIYLIYQTLIVLKDLWKSKYIQSIFTLIKVSGTGNSEVITNYLQADGSFKKTNQRTQITQIQLFVWTDVQLGNETVSFGLCAPLWCI